MGQIFSTRNSQMAKVKLNSIMKAKAIFCSWSFDLVPSYRRVDS